MDSFETSRNHFQLQTATWEYFQNGYNAKITLADGIYEGFINGEFIDATVVFQSLCSLLIIEIRNREKKFAGRIGDPLDPVK